MESARRDALHRRGILYAPDYAINAGGLISAYIDWKEPSTEGIMKKVKEIGDRIGEIISASKKTGEPTHTIAHKVADERIQKKKKEKDA